MNLHSALARLEGTFAARIRKGIAVGDITLRAADSDRTAFTQLLTMLNEAERLDMLPPPRPLPTATEWPTNCPPLKCAAFSSNTAGSFSLSGSRRSP